MISGIVELEKEATDDVDDHLTWLQSQVFDSCLQRRRLRQWSQLNLNHVTVTGFPHSTASSGFLSVVEAGRNRRGTCSSSGPADGGGAASCDKGNESGAVVVIHPAVEYRVDTGRAERHDAAQHVAQLEKATEHEIMTEFSDH